MADLVVQPWVDPSFLEGQRQGGDTLRTILQGRQRKQQIETQAEQERKTKEYEQQLTGRTLAPALSGVLSKDPELAARYGVPITSDQSFSVAQPGDISGVKPQAGPAPRPNLNANVSPERAIGLKDVFTKEMEARTATGQEMAKRKATSAPLADYARTILQQAGPKLHPYYQASLQGVIKALEAGTMDPADAKAMLDSVQSDIRQQIGLELFAGNQPQGTGGGLGQFYTPMVTQTMDSTGKLGLSRKEATERDVFNRAQRYIEQINDRRRAGQQIPPDEENLYRAATELSNRLRPFMLPQGGVVLDRSLLGGDNPPATQGQPGTGPARGPLGATPGYQAIPGAIAVNPPTSTDAEVKEAGNEKAAYQRLKDTVERIKDLPDLASAKGRASLHLRAYLQGNTPFEVLSAQEQDYVTAHDLLRMLWERANSGGSSIFRSPQMIKMLNETVGSYWTPGTATRLQTLIKMAEQESGAMREGQAGGGRRPIMPNLGEQQPEKGAPKRHRYNMQGEEIK